MPFQDYSKLRPLPEREQDILRFWKENKIFEKSVEKNKSGEPFVFFEGPPTANGKPGIHHVLARVYKDIYVRYQSLKGKAVPRKAGWDTHGLPVEREVEKELGIKTKAEIETTIGLEKFNELCRKSVYRYVEDWRTFTERLGFWLDMDAAYFTLHNSYIESVWSLLKTIWEKGLIYQGYKVVPYDPVMGATMSDAEVAQGYRTVEDPSLTVRFKIRDKKKFGDNAYFLVWTTTPWTLPSNVALALAAKEEYVLIEREMVDATVKKQIEHLICAAALEGQLFGDSKRKTKKTFKGAELENVKYEPIFNYIKLDKKIKSHYTVCGDFVTMDTGTGIVHIAPAYGADDLEVGKKYDLPVLHAVGLDGKFAEGTAMAGVFFKDADPLLIKDLKQRGLVWKSEKYKHEYPFGWRTGAPLLYYAKDAWYIKTTQVRSELIANNETINWFPETIKRGRFGNWLENNRDWALSRERYWGTPLPVWTDGENFKIIGSVSELEKLTGKNLKELDLHRPYIDRIEWTDEKTGRTFKRVPEVIDCWFDSGAMPYAQWGYDAFAGQGGSGQAGTDTNAAKVRGADEFSKAFPADFISEAVDQTRGWFYTLLAISTMVSEKAPFKNVICLGHVVDAHGEKMSKSKGNTVDPDKVFQTHGADAIRWYFLTNSPPGNSRRVGQPGSPEDPVALVFGFFNMLQNSIGFFTMYANVDGIQTQLSPRPGVKGASPFAQRPEIDRWILSSLQQLIDDVTASLDSYDSQKAGKLIESFIDSLSNWYIRRNRRRFWKGSLDEDKLSAYDTLYLCLMSIVELMMPFTPFLAEDAYRALTSGASEGEKFPESIHLLPWPVSDRSLFDSKILEEGNVVQKAAFLGRSARQLSGVKVRQPLSRLMIHAMREEDRSAIEKNRDVLLDELNVKDLEFIADSAGILDYRIKPNLPRLGKRMGQKLRELQEFFKTCDARKITGLAKSGAAFEISLPSGTVSLEAEDVLIESMSREGISGAEGDGMLVALDTKLTPELRQEGMARDFVRNVQELRKNSGLNVTDRILLFAAGGDDFLAAQNKFKAFIEEETLAEIQKDAVAGSPAGSAGADIGGEKIQIQIWQK